MSVMGPAKRTENNREQSFGESADSKPISSPPSTTTTSSAIHSSLSNKFCLRWDCLTTLTTPHKFVSFRSRLANSLGKASKKRTELSQFYKRSRDGEGGLVAAIATAIAAIVVFDRFGLIEKITISHSAVEHALTIVYTVILGLIVIFLWERLGKSSYYPDRPRLTRNLKQIEKEIFYSLLIGLFVWTAVSLIAASLGVLSRDPTTVTFSATDAVLRLATFLVLVPIEEVYFRGYLQRPLAVAGPRWLAVTMTATLFAAYHIPTYQSQGYSGSGLLAMLGVVFGIGLAAGHAYERTDDLSAAIITHLLLNVFILVSVTAGSSL